MPSYEQGYINELYYLRKELDEAKFWTHWLWYLPKSYERINRQQELEIKIQIVEEKKKSDRANYIKKYDENTDLLNKDIKNILTDRGISEENAIILFRFF